VLRCIDAAQDAGVLYFGTKLDMSPFKRARKVGLAQGLVDFTRCAACPIRTRPLDTMPA
jgi:hypothetical protein